MKWETQNEFVRGAVAGAASAVVICLFMEAMEMLKLVKHCWLFMAGQAVMNFNHKVLPLVAFSFLIHLGVGAIWGVITAFLLSKVFSDRYYLLKGLLIGSSIFFLLLGILDRVLHYPPKVRQEPLTMFFIFLSYVIYGLLTSFIIKKWPWRKTSAEAEKSGNKLAKLK